jgi:hypothetical protein
MFGKYFPKIIDEGKIGFLWGWKNHGGRREKFFHTRVHQSYHDIVHAFLDNLEERCFS